MLSSVGQHLLGLVLLLQAGVDDLVALGRLVAHARMDHHLLGGLVHGQQLAQFDERLSRAPWCRMR